MLDNLREQFNMPDKEFTVFPLWLWNDDLKEDELKRQIHDFKSKGVDAFVIHPRIGIPRSIPYMSDRFMELVKFATEEAISQDMLVGLYDEGMYPSGAADGLVVKGNPEYASRGLKMTELAPGAQPELEEAELLIAAVAVEKTGETSIKAGSERVLNCEGGSIVYGDTAAAGLEGMTVLAFTEIFSRGHIRGIHEGEDDRDPGAPPSADLLNHAAMQKFIRVTHDRYYETIGKYFGKEVVFIFTDEPTILGRGGRRNLRPWTGGFMEYAEARGLGKRDLPALWLDAGADTELTRIKYRDIVRIRLEEAFYKPIGKWCEEHNIALTGHPQDSEDIGVMKHYQIPGNDTVWRWVAPEDGKAINGGNSTLAKSSSDSARHRGKRRNSNEVFGCDAKNGSNQWTMDANDMKWYLDWLFVRGVNMMIPHSFFYADEGDIRRWDRPPCVGPKNTWWRYYRTVADYIKRMSWLTTDMYNVTPVAMLCSGDRLPWVTARELYQNQIEFNYLEQEILLGDAGIGGGSISIENQRYTVVIVEDTNMVDDAVNAALLRFIAEGGSVITLKSDRMPEACIKGQIIEEPAQITAALDKAGVRDVRSDIYVPDLRMTHMLKEGKHVYLFVNEQEEEIDCRLTLSAYGAIERWDPWAGSTEKISALSASADTGVQVPMVLGRRESVVFVVDPEEAPAIDPKVTEFRQIGSFTIDRGWTLQKPDGSKIAADDHPDWSKMEDIATFAGTLPYTVSFSISSDMIENADRVIIDLGDVAEIAALRVNGKEAGLRMWAPYRFDAAGLLKNGINELTADITNTAANRMGRGVYKSGLFGPVTVTLSKKA